MAESCGSLILMAKRVERLYLTEAARKEREAWQGGDIVEPS